MAILFFNTIYGHSLEIQFPESVYVHLLTVEIHLVAILLFNATAPYSHFTVRVIIWTCCIDVMVHGTHTYTVHVYTWYTYMVYTGTWYTHVHGIHRYMVHTRTRYMFTVPTWCYLLIYTYTCSERAHVCAHTWHTIASCTCPGLQWKMKACIPTVFMLINLPLTWTSIA